MADSDILIGSLSGDNSTVDWYTTSGYSTPLLAASRQDDVGVGKCTIHTLAGVTTMEVEDVPVPSAAGAGPVQMIWAHSNDNLAALNYHGPARGSFALDFTGGGTFFLSFSLSFSLSLFLSFFFSCMTFFRSFCDLG